MIKKNFLILNKQREETENKEIFAKDTIDSIKATKNNQKINLLFLKATTEEKKIIIH